jgi:hypothetical protein
VDDQDHTAEVEQAHRAHVGADHRGAKLRGADLSGAQLAGADFREADLRGADLSGANLAGADFRDSRVGLRPMATVALYGAALLVGVLAGAATGKAAEVIRDRLATWQWQDVMTGGATLVVVLLFLGAWLLRGPRVALATLVIALLVAALGSWVVASVFGEARLDVWIQFVALVLVVATALMAGIMGRVLGGAWGQAGIIVVALTAGLVAGRAGGGIGVIAVSVLIVVLSKRALRGDRRDRLVVRAAQRIIRLRSTSFARADLSGADFSGANIAHCDTTGAVVEGVTWGDEDEAQASA